MRTAGEGLLPVVRRQMEKGRSGRWKTKGVAAAASIEIKVFFKVFCMLGIVLFNSP
ncbi:hypothetical protein OIU77_026422, partial [Salix suchowensis]